MKKSSIDVFQQFNFEGNIFILDFFIQADTINLNQCRKIKDNILKKLYVHIEKKNVLVYYV